MMATRPPGAQQAINCPILRCFSKICEAHTRSYFFSCIHRPPPAQITSAPGVTDASSEYTEVSKSI